MPIRKMSGNLTKIMFRVLLRISGVVKEKKMKFCQNFREFYNHKYQTLQFPSSLGVYSDIKLIVQGGRAVLSAEAFREMAYMPGDKISQNLADSH